MPYEKLRSIRPLTPLMLELLKDCFEREKQKVQPSEFYDPALVQGLIERGLIGYKPKGREEGKIYKVTSLGKEYMEHYFGK